MQDYSIAIAIALDIVQSCTKPSIYYTFENGIDWSSPFASNSNITIFSPNSAGCMPTAINVKPLIQGASYPKTYEEVVRAAPTGAVPTTSECIINNFSDSGIDLWPIVQFLIVAANNLAQLVGHNISIMSEYLWKNANMFSLTHLHWDYILGPFLDFKNNTVRTNYEKRLDWVYGMWKYMLIKPYYSRGKTGKKLWVVTYIYKSK